MILQRKNNRRGQGMTEYIIIVALIAVAAIGITRIFGGSIRHQMAKSINGFLGNNENDGIGRAPRVREVTTKDRSMKDFSDTASRR